MKRRNGIIKRVLSVALTGVMVVSGGMFDSTLNVSAAEQVPTILEDATEINTEEVVADAKIAEDAATDDLSAYSTDEIMLASFWTSMADNTDTLYWSVDGVNFYELAEAYTDAYPNDDTKAILTKPYYDYKYDANGNPVFIYNVNTYNSFIAYKATKWDAQGNVLETEPDPTTKVDYPNGNPNYGHSTLHDPSIAYRDGYFWMVSGFVSGTGDNETLVPMFGYSKDLENWSFPSSGSSTNISLEAAPAGKEKYGNQWDIVAPEMFVDDDGTVYLVFCAGFFAMWHGESSANDIMQPYIVKVTSLTATGDPAVSAERLPVATYDTAKQIQLPCMQAGHERYHVANNHIDGSLYKEGGYYYYTVKENGVTDEIWRISDLSKASDPNAWEQVIDDAISGYEGPSLTKFQNEYFLYVDRLEGFLPEDSEERFTSQGVHVIKATTNTTGKLDKYSGFLETNLKEINTYDKNGAKKANRHGTIITLTGEAAQVVRQLAKKVNPNLTDRDLQPAYNASSWQNTGWYHKESYRYEKFGDKVVRYYYINGIRQGVKFNSDGSVDPNYRGKEIYDSITNGWYWMDAISDGSMAVSKDVYQESAAGPYGAYSAEEAIKLGYEVTDMNARYGKWVRYDEFGRMYKGQVYAPKDGTDEWCYWYFDEVFGTMLKGVVSVPKVVLEWVPLLNFKGEPVKYVDGNIRTTQHWYMVDEKGQRTEDASKAAYRTVCYNVVDGTMQFGFVPVGNELYYFNPGGEAVTGWITNSSTLTPGYEKYGEEGQQCWYEDGKRAGFKMVLDGNGNPVIENGKAKIDLSYRGKEIYDGIYTNQWFWCDNVLFGSMAKSKEVYQESAAGPWAADPETGTGKWVRYGSGGEMIKGWYSNSNGVYYYDLTFGTMARGTVVIEGVTYEFDSNTGILKQ